MKIHFRDSLSNKDVLVMSLEMFEQTKMFFEFLPKKDVLDIF